MCKYHWRVMYLTFAITVVIMLIWLTLAVVQQKKPWKRFTYDDWVILYELCTKKKWVQTTNILKMYWEKETDFKKLFIKTITMFTILIWIIIVFIILGITLYYLYNDQ